MFAELSKVAVSPTRGMRDILPVEAASRASALATIRSVYLLHGFTEIETPVVESLELLAGGGGGENEKLIFRILKRGERLEEAISADSIRESDLADTGLRFDLTVPLARFYAANHHRLPHPFRSCQIGPVFRAERPQKGRYRQFQQVDIDVVGDDGPQAEVDLLTAAISALDAIGVEDFTVRINDRRILEELAAGFGFTRDDFVTLFISLDKLDKLSVGEVVDELAERGMDRGASSELIGAISDLRTSHDSLLALAEHKVPTDLLERLLWIKETTSSTLAGNTTSGFGVVVDPLVIRGMAYYTSSVFEVGHSGWGTSIAGGGRYDDMLSRFGRPAPAAGISLGFERIMGLLAELGSPVRMGQSLTRTTVIYDPRDQTDQAAAIARAIRSEGEVATQQMRAKNLGSQLKRLEAEALEQRSQGSKDRFFYRIVGREESVELASVDESGASASD